jgi:hypothetical protein
VELNLKEKFTGSARFPCKDITDVIAEMGNEVQHRELIVHPSVQLS